jgi:hypothetical protein
MRSVRARLRSPRGADRATLVLPASRLVSASIEGHPVPLSILEHGWHPLTCATLPPAGVSVELTFHGEAPVDAFVMDTTRHLPPGGEALQRARPAFTTPRHDGDAWILTRPLNL